jgi:hypothetical protein
MHVALVRPKETGQVAHLNADPELTQPRYYDTLLHDFSNRHNHNFLL